MSIFWARAILTGSNERCSKSAFVSIYGGSICKNAQQTSDCSLDLADWSRVAAWSRSFSIALIAIFEFYGRLLVGGDGRECAFLSREENEESSQVRIFTLRLEGYSRKFCLRSSCNHIVCDWWSILLRVMQQAASWPETSVALLHNDPDYMGC